MRFGIRKKAYKCLLRAIVECVAVLISVRKCRSVHAHVVFPASMSYDKV